MLISIFIMNYHLTHRQNAVDEGGKLNEVRNSEHQLTHNCKHFSGANVQTFSETTKKKGKNFYFCVQIVVQRSTFASVQEGACNK